MQKFANIPRVLVTLLLGGLIFTSRVSAEILYASDSGAGCIYAITSNGKVSVFVKGLISPGSLVSDGHGGLYVACGPEFYKISAGGRATNLGVPVMASGSASFTLNTNRLALDSSGSLLALNTLGGGVYKILPSGATTGGTPSFGNVQQIVADAHDNVYVSSVPSGNIIVFSPVTGKVEIIGGITRPTGMAVTAQGDLLVVNAPMGISSGPPSSVSPAITKISATRVQTLYAEKIDLDPPIALNHAGKVFVTLVGGKEIYVETTPGHFIPFATVSGHIDGLAFDRSPVTISTIPRATIIDDLPPPKPNPGLLIAFTAPALILILAVIVWLVRRRAEDKT